ncbi:MATE family efflux transporter [Parvibium lacunae]|uniref:Multidrug-efflux transporter n=1 Tax=Parvibium lacunae TaxID=1888893 RepID=A0A368L492_9BURK|nr:MATE family efflux transporter [Parvibium lacunae]RCS58401.1 MATE family efflux transporter [Parvibium lacunae]
MPPLSVTHTARQIMHLAWPLFIGQLAVMLNGLLDTAMAGHYAAVDLAAVGIGSSIYISVYIGLMGILQALGPIAARHYGAQALPEIAQDVRQSYWVALLLSVLGCAALLTPDWWLQLIQPDERVADKVRDYLYGVAYGLPAALLFRVYYALNTAVARPRVVMAINLCGLAIKPLLNWLLMYQADLGGPGAALATSGIAWLSVGLFLLFARHDTMYRELDLWRLSRPAWGRIRALLALGIPIGMSYAIEVTSFTFMALFIARFGVEQAAAHQIIANLCGICYMVSLAIANASSVLVAQALGSQESHQAQRFIKVALGLGTLASASLILTLWLAQAPLVQLYTNATMVQEHALSLLPLLLLYLCFDGLQCILGFLLRAYRCTTLPMLIYGFCCWGIGLGGGYFLAFHTQQWSGAAGFWLSGAISLLLTALCLFGVMRRRVYQRS